MSKNNVLYSRCSATFNLSYLLSSDIRLCLLPVSAGTLLGSCLESLVTTSFKVTAECISDRIPKIEQQWMKL